MILTDSFGLSESFQSLSDKLILLQHLGDGPEDKLLRLSSEGEKKSEEKEKRNGVNRSCLIRGSRGHKIHI